MDEIEILTDELAEYEQKFNETRNSTEKAEYGEKIKSISKAIRELQSKAGEKEIKINGEAPSRADHEEGTARRVGVSSNSNNVFISLY